MNPQDFNSFYRHASIVAIAFIFLFCSKNLYASPSTKLTILVYGDSLSANYGIKTEDGWVNLLREKLEHAPEFPNVTFDIINASISGETTGGGLARFQETLDRVKPNMIILALGANDGLRGFPIKLIRQNLEQMIKTAVLHNISILFCGIQIPLNYGPRYTRLMEQMYSNLATQYQLTFLPSLLGNIPLDTTLMQGDNLHPNTEAQTLLLEHIYPEFKPLIEERVKNTSKQIPLVIQ